MNTPEYSVQKGFSFVPKCASAFGFESVPVVRGTPSPAPAPAPPPRELIPSPLSMPNLPEDLRDPKTFNPAALAKYLFPDRDRSKPLTPREFDLLTTHPLWASSFNNAASGRWDEARARWQNNGADESDLSEFYDAAHETGLYPTSYDENDTHHEHPMMDFDNGGDLEMLGEPSPEWLKKNDLASNVLRRTFSNPKSSKA